MAAAQQATRQAPRPATTPEDSYAELRSRLEQRRSEIIGRTADVRSRLDEQIMSAPGDAADESVIDTGADYFLSLAQTLQHELVEIQDALARMRRGAYGACESCEDPIPVERLAKLPYARLCVGCQASRERANPLRAL